MSFVEIQQVPYVKHVPTDGRSVILSAYYDHQAKQWSIYQPYEGKVLALPVSTLVEGFYVSEAPADKNSDVRIELPEFVFQHFSVPALVNIDDQIAQDLVNQLAGIHKYFVILHHMNVYDDGTAIDLMSSEIEYALTNHRSFYDILNRAVREILRHTTSGARKLPDSFRKVAQQAPEHLSEKFGLPTPIVEFYKAKEVVFMMLRDLRDSVVHHGKTPDSVYHFADGFGLSVDRHLFSAMQPLRLWPSELLKENRIGSLLAVFNFLARDMFDTMNILAQQLKLCFKELPRPVAEGYSTYLRSRFTPHLVRSDEYAARQWIAPGEMLKLSERRS